MTGQRDMLHAAREGDADALDHVMRENSGLVWSIVRRFLGRGVDADDLYQLGCMGLLKAVRGFDSAFGTQFSTYAVPKISGEIRRFLRDDGTVKVSRGLKEQNGKIRAARTALALRLGRDPVLSELAAETGLTPEEIAQAEFATGSAESLSRTAGEDGQTLEDKLGDFFAEERMVEHVALSDALARLPDRSRRVLLLRFFHGITQEKAAGLLGISQVQVSRIERAALLKLRELIIENTV